MSKESWELRDEENNLAANEGGLIGQLIRDCQEVQHDAFTFEGISKALGYPKEDERVW